MEKIKSTEEVTYIKKNWVTLCDKCDSEIDVYGYDVFEAEFIYRKGEVYPACDFYGTSLSVHLCQNCVGDFLELLKKNDYRINEDK